MSLADGLIAELADRQHGVVGASQLLERGVTREQIKRRVTDCRLRRLHRGVYAAGRVRPNAHGRWMAAVIAGGPRACLSHRAGAALWDLVAPDWRPIDVTVPGGSRSARRGIVTHRSRLAPEDCHVIDATPVTSLARTLLDLAEVTSPTQHRRAYERAERLELLDTRAIDRLLERSNGRHGVGRLRALLDYDPTAAARAESELERLFLDLVRAHELPTPQVNVLVEGFLVDAYWPAARLVVELDSYEHHTDREAFESDRARHSTLRLAGCHSVAFTYRQVVDRPAWVASVVRHLLARAAGEANL